MLKTLFYLQFVAASWLGGWVAGWVTGGLGYV